MHISHEVQQSEKLAITTVSGHFDFGELKIDQLFQWGKGELDEH
jgi:hypothetical protein